MTTTQKLIQPKRGLLKLSDKAEVSSAEEQLTRNNLTDENDKAVEQNPTAFIPKSFVSQMP